MAPDGARLETALSERLDVEHPIVQAPIGDAAGPALAAAVSNAGGLGTLAVTWTAPEDAREAVRETRARTDGPFAVNVVLDPEATPIPTEEHLEACLEAGAPLVSLSFGDPSAYVDRIHDAGALALATVGSAAEARAAADAGADVVVAQGWEAGGHLQGEVATLPLVPRVADAVEVPVVAAGGIADGRGVAAALALGADGAWLGTRFVATEEADAHPAYKRAVAGAAETDTVRTELFDAEWPDVPHRTLRNETVRRWERAGRPAEDRPGEGEQVASTPDGEPIERYSAMFPLPGMEGDLGEMALYAGQSAGLAPTVEPAAAVVEALVAGAERAIDGLAALRG